METVRTAIKNMPSSAVANIFAAGAVEPDIAAKILDGLDMDIADGIIAALPPANADQICNLVKDDDLRSRAADRAIVVLHLPNWKATDGKKPRRVLKPNLLCFLRTQRANASSKAVQRSTARYMSWISRTNELQRFPSKRKLKICATGRTPFDTRV